MGNNLGFGLGLDLMDFDKIFGFLTGAAAGSFLGVVIERSGCEVSQTSHSGKFAKLRARSRCSSCGHQLAWWENIPLVSFVILKGKCRRCRSPIPYWLPLIELAGAAAGAVIAAQVSQISPIWLISQILIAAALVWIFFSDLVYGLVPDWAVALGALGAIVMKFAKLPITLAGFANFTIPALAAAAFFWLLAAATAGRGMGAGDITLAFFLGLWLGWPLILPALWLAFIIGAIGGVGLIIFKKKKLKSAIPFGPFMIIGALLSPHWGMTIIKLFGF